jgi:very-short-patch-repair endonuclease
MDTTDDLSAARSRRRRREQARLLAAGQAGVLSRTQLYAAGFTRGEVRANVRAGRWVRLGAHCVRTDTGAMTVNATWWSGVLEAGPRAFLDGETALLAAGLQHYESTRVRVTVPRGARVRHRATKIDIRQTRRWQPDDVVGEGLPRARPEVAAIRAALWARSDRQATLLLTMCVQQGIVDVAGLAEQLLRIRRDRRRALIQAVLLDLVGGASSLGELDVLRGCRERGIPEPDVQVLRRTATGTYYLDFRWKRRKVVLEVDGIQHAWVEQIVPDALRHNSIAMSGDTVLRLPVLGLRLCPDAFFAQLAQALERADGPVEGRPA